MKTTTHTPGIQRTAILIALFLHLTVFLSAQQHVLPDAVGIKTKLSGSGLIPSPTLTANYHFGKCQLEFGAGLQTRRPHLSRIESTFYYTLTGSEQERSHLVAFGNVDYNFGVCLRNKTADCERKIHRESRVDYAALRVSTFEYQAGFGMFIRIFKQVQLYSGIGFGMYHTIGASALDSTPFRDRNSCTIMLSGGLFFGFGEKENSR